MVAGTMYLRRCRQHSSSGTYSYWKLVESVRTARGPRQRVVAYLGDLDPAGRLGLRQAAGSSAGADSSPGLFPEGAPGPRFVEIDTSRVRVENVRSFGGSWLALELIEKLGLRTFLGEVLPPGRAEIGWDAMSLVLVILRLLSPSSELRIAEHLFERTALDTLLGIGAAKVNDDRLYRTLDEWVMHKEALQKHLKNRLGELFKLQYDLLLYDVTSTYFEGQCQGNTRAAGAFKTQIGTDEKGRVMLTWEKVESWRNWAQLSEGCYLLRSNVRNWTAEELWKAYMQLTEAEGAFRIHKSDLTLRPVWHQKQGRVEAHILVCFLAYVLWKTLGQWCKAAGLGDEPRKVLDEIAQVSMVDVVPNSL
jgi:hypothetical protein